VKVRRFGYANRCTIATIFKREIFPRWRTLCGCVVSMAKEFYENADECLGWANTAKTERERLIFMEMRNAWLEAARKCEAKEVRSNPREQPQSHAE
jgi:hypothetical protein